MISLGETITMTDLTIIKRVTITLLVEEIREEISIIKWTIIDLVGLCK